CRTGLVLPDELMESVLTALRASVMAAPPPVGNED
ncbi:lipoate--protein ligase family protein, partial [Mesorhizobium sp. M8A.F.Ca.ET.181.01.1.1]